jgi:hypothetical protein
VFKTHCVLVCILVTCLRQYVTYSSALWFMTPSRCLLCFTRASAWLCLWHSQPWWFRVFLVSWCFRVFSHIVFELQFESEFDYLLHCIFPPFGSVGFTFPSIKQTKIPNQNHVSM